MKYVALGKEEGARLVTGGSRYGSKGMFVIPTIFVDVKLSNKLFPLGFSFLSRKDHAIL